MKWKREGGDPEVEEALNHCFNAVLAKVIQIMGTIWKNKSKELVQKLGRPVLLLLMAGCHTRKQGIR